MKVLSLLRSLITRVPGSTHAIRAYHFLWAYGAALWYGFPSRSLVVVGVTGTKGKTTVTEMLAAILREAGKPVALANTIHFLIGNQEERNTLKMTMPGRGFLQHFLARAKRAGVRYAVVEMTSQGAEQFRHLGLELDGFIFTMLEPEHIEAHGSFEAYRNAKRALFSSLLRSSKPNRFVVANEDDAEGQWYLADRSSIRAIPFSLREARKLRPAGKGSVFEYRGQRFELALPGQAAVANALAAIKAAEALGVPLAVAAAALAKLSSIPGRLERVWLPSWPEQDVEVVVDYAHTPESLRSLYEAFAGKHLICVLGSCGGGRDRWKRPKLGAIAETYCNRVYLTDEDPYDEDPRDIVEEIRAGFRRKEPTIELDRRKAIMQAIQEAPTGGVVILSGKGTDPYIMGPNGERTPWSEAAVAREALAVRKRAKENGGERLL